MVIQVVLGTPQEKQLSALVGCWITGGLCAPDQLEMEVVDTRYHPLPFFDGEAPAKANRQYSSTPTPW